jgi:hypothetical protein
MTYCVSRFTLYALRFTPLYWRCEMKTKFMTMLHLIVLLPLLTACGLLDAGVEPVTTPALTPTPTAAGQTAVATEVATETPTAEATATPPATATPAAEEPPATLSPTATPTPAAAPALRVAYVKDNNVWLWTADADPIALTQNGGVEDVILSDDGQRIAFKRGGQLWVVNSDGSDERQLVADADLAAIVPEDATGIVVYQVGWLPGSHTLLFNTSPQFDAPGLLLSDDLWLVDVATPELRNLLPPGEGGNFVPSPDGQQIAIIDPGSIDVIAADGSNRRQVLTYTPVLTYSEFQYYASPVWTAESDALRVAIPPADPLAATGQPTSIWHIPADGTPAQLLGNVTAAPFGGDPIFSPDLNRIVYLVEIDPETGQRGVAVAEFGSQGELTETLVYEEAVGLDSWSPDGRTFVFMRPADGGMLTAVLGAVDQEPIPLSEAGAVVVDVQWLDADSLILTRQAGEQTWDIVLRHLDGAETPIDIVTGFPPAIDLAN